MKRAVPVREASRKDLTRGPSILVIDDDPLARRLMEVVLEGVGDHVHTAHHGLDAMQHPANPAPPHVIISDVMMPCLSGTDLVEQLAAQPDLAHIPLLLRSACHELAHDVGTAAIVAKPFAPKSLLALIRDLLAEPEPPINVLRELRRLTP